MRICTIWHSLYSIFHFLRIARRWWCVGVMSSKRVHKCRTYINECHKAISRNSIVWPKNRHIVQRQCVEALCTNPTKIATQDPISSTQGQKCYRINWFTKQHISSKPSASKHTNSHIPSSFTILLPFVTILDRVKISWLAHPSLNNNDLTRRLHWKENHYWQEVLTEEPNKISCT